MPHVVRYPSSEGYSQRHALNPRASPYLRNKLPKSALGIVNQFRRSKVSIPAIRNDILEFGNTRFIKVNDKLDYAIRQAYEAFKLDEKVKMTHLNDVFKRTDLPIWSSSPGIPWKQQGYKTKRQVADDPKAVERVRLYWHRVKSGIKTDPPPCAAFFRSHLVEKHEPDKIRAVWGYNVTLTTGEAVFALNLIDGYKRKQNPIAYGYETAVGGPARLRAEISGAFYHALDFKSFDKTVPKFFIIKAFDILAQNIDFVNYETRGVADPKKNAAMWKHLVRYFIETPIRMCTGENFRKFGGIASGSYFTQLVGSIVNYILITYFCLETTGVGPSYIRVFGDDSIFTTPSANLNIHKCAELAKSFGMEINVKKSKSSLSIGDLSFLGYEIGFRVPHKPLAAWWAALLFPEQDDRSWDDVASRALGLLYANMGVDEEFYNCSKIIVEYKPFIFKLSRSLEKYFRVAGVEISDSTVPELDTLRLKCKI